MNTGFTISGFADEIDQDLNKQLEVIGKLGIKYIEMRGVDGNNLIFHSNAKVHEIKKRLDDAGVSLSALGSPIGKIGIDDPFEPHFEALKRAVEVSHMMDCRRIRMFSFYIPQNDNPANYREKVLDRLGRFVEYAFENDALLLHENEKGIYGEKAAECLELMNALEGKAFGAIFDFANFVQAKQNTLEAYDMLKKYITYIHVKDAVWETGKVVPVGYGDGNVEAILKKLAADGYNGFLSLEPHLFDFAGFRQLEEATDVTSILPDTNGKKTLTGEEAFTLAHQSLQKLLMSI